MVIKNGSLPDANDVQKTIQAFLEESIQNKKNDLSNYLTRNYSYVETLNASTGDNTTIDTGNTTATFTITDKKYYNYDSTASTTAENTGITYDSGGTISLKSGLKILTGTKPVALISFTKDGSTTATTGYLLDSGKNVVTSAAFSGNTCTFSSVQFLDANTYYYLAVDDGGSNYTSRYTTSVSYPYAGTYLSYTTSLTNNADNASQANDIAGCVIRVGFTNKIVQTNLLLTAPANITSIFVTCLNNSTGGSGSINYDVSVDNGSTWTTGLSLNTCNSITSTAGTQLKLKINLNGSGTANFAILKYIGIEVW